MSTNSQEQAIYRSLAGQIQMGFYDDGERFPSVQEVAFRYHVSYCPAQRALKSLESDGLIRLCRGKETMVLGKPYVNYLAGASFQARAAALPQLLESLELLSPSVTVQGLLRLHDFPVPDFTPGDAGRTRYAKLAYRMFDRALQALGNRTALSLYYDVGAFVESALWDILYAVYEDEDADARSRQLGEVLVESLRACRTGQQAAALAELRSLARSFFRPLRQYLGRLPPSPSPSNRQSFSWEPCKGRTRYCDVIAIDLVCKINQGVYPVGTLMPLIPRLADTYHVSAITMRRAISILNRLGVVRTSNGVGTRVVFRGDDSIPQKLKDLMLDDNLRVFLEALQLLSITVEDVVRYTFPHFSRDAHLALQQALVHPGQNAARVAVISACMQAVVRCCPLAPIRDIYGKITLLLLRGSVLRLNETGAEPVSGWPEIAAGLSSALYAGDGPQFAAVFRRLADQNFRDTKRLLLKIGVSGLDELVTPEHGNPLP